jgi:SAM-dependent methyltransferase
MTIPIGVECLMVKLQERITPVTELDEKWYEWQSLSLTAFYSALTDVRNNLGPGRFKFLDVGSGIGTKLYLADSLNFEPHGIEINPAYVDISKELFPEYPVKCVSATEYRSYDKFDVIYSYRLARDDILQHQVSQWIGNLARPGAALILAGVDPMAQSFEMVES